MTKVEFYPKLKIKVLYEVIGPFVKRTQYDGRNFSNGVVCVTKKSYTKKTRGIFLEDFVADVFWQHLLTAGITRFVIQNRKQLEVINRMFSINISDILVMSEMDYVKNEMIKRNNLHRRTIVSEDMSRILRYKQS